jgi:hypothetical protein
MPFGMAQQTMARMQIAVYLLHCEYSAMKRTVRLRSAYAVLSFGYCSRVGLHGACTLRSRSSLHGSTFVKNTLFSRDIVRSALLISSPYSSLAYYSVMAAYALIITLAIYVLVM